MGVGKKEIQEKEKKNNKKNVVLLSTNFLTHKNWGIHLARSNG